MTFADGRELPRDGIQVPFPGEGIITLHPVERWHVEHGNRWLGTNKANLYNVEWDNKCVGKVQLHYLGVKKYRPSAQYLEENPGMIWISDDQSDYGGRGETSSDSEIISPVSESSSEGEIVVAAGSEAARRKAVREAKAAKTKAREEKKASHALEAAAKQRAMKAINADLKKKGQLYLSKRGTHWGKDPNGESEALALVIAKAVLKDEKLKHKMRKAEHARELQRAKAAEKAAKKAAARGDEAGMQMTL